jgi:chitinase
MANGMDGVDFDWEYPGATDIRGIPPGSPEDGTNYLSFLQMVRKELPPQYSISIAAPASYWYLRGFPIANISSVVDYIVYMTYDLHGQWDYANHFSE